MFSFAEKKKKKKKKNTIEAVAMQCCELRFPGFWFLPVCKLQRHFVGCYTKIMCMRVEGGGGGTAKREIKFQGK